MTDKQPEALRLADILESWKGAVSNEAAAELRRLHELTEVMSAVGIRQESEILRLHKMNAELVGALKDIRDNYDCDEDAHKYGSRCRSCVARAAIAKATGGQQ